MDRSLFHVGARPEQLPQSPMPLLEYIIYLYNTIRQETLRLTSTCIRRGNTHLCSSAVKMIHVWHLKSSIYLCNLLCELHCLNCLNDFSWTQAPIKKCQARTSAENVTITQGSGHNVARARAGYRSQSPASWPAASQDFLCSYVWRLLMFLRSNKMYKKLRFYSICWTVCFTRKFIIYYWGLEKYAYKNYVYDEMEY